MQVTQTGNTLVDQKTQADAVGGVVTFSEPIHTLEIFNVDTTNTGVFTVNGVNITIPPKTPFKATIGRTSSKTVSVSGSTSYILSLYE